jgi:hypothetical protein
VKDKVIYCEPVLEEMPPFGAGMCFVFVFVYVGEMRPLQFVTSCVANSADPISSIFHTARRKMGLSASAEYQIFSARPDWVAPREIFVRDDPCSKLALGNIGLVVFQLPRSVRVPDSVLYRPPSDPRRKFFLDDADLPNMSFDQFLIVARRRTTLQLVTPDHELVEVIVPEFVGQSRLKEFFATSLEIPYDEELDRMDIVLDADHSRVDDANWNSPTDLYRCAAQIGASATFSVVVRTGSVDAIPVFASKSGYSAGKLRMRVVPENLFFGELFQRAVGRHIFQPSDVQTVRFLCKRESPLLDVHRNFEAMVTPDLWFVRIEIIPDDQQTIDTEKERLCQLRIVKEQDDGEIFLFKLIANEQLTQFKRRLDDAFKLTGPVRVVVEEDGSTREMIAPDIPYDTVGSGYVSVIVSKPGSSSPRLTIRR